MTVAKKGLILTGLLAVAGCSNLKMVPLKPSTASKGPDAPLARIEVKCSSFNILTLAVPRECDRELVVKKMLLQRARRIGASRVTGVRFAATSDRGLWWLTRLLGFRRAYASATLMLAREHGGR